MCGGKNSPSPDLCRFDFQLLLEQHPKGDRRKVKIARRLRQETTMTLKWIADRLKMGTWTHATNRLYHLKK
jgi:hypothetical protein